MKTKLKLNLKNIRLHNQYITHKLYKFRKMKHLRKHSQKKTLCNTGMNKLFRKRKRRKMKLVYNQATTLRPNHSNPKLRQLRSTLKQLEIQWLSKPKKQKKIQQSNKRATIFLRITLYMKNKHLEVYRKIRAIIKGIFKAHLLF